MRTIHPGVWLKPRLLRRTKTVADAARRLDYSVTGLWKILNGERDMTMRLALTVEARFGFSALTLMQKQLKFDFAALNDKVLADLMEEE